MIFKLLYFLLLLLHIQLYASFKGAVVDAKTLQPISAAFISDSFHEIKSDKNGLFFLDSNESNYSIKAYGYRPFHFNVDSNNSIMKLSPIKVKALYLTFWGASNNSKTFKNALEIIEKSELNALVVDVKNEYGYTLFLTSFKEANSYGAQNKRTNRDIGKFIKTLKDRGIYTIARIVTFKDEIQAINNPEYIVRKKNGTIWRNSDNIAWVDPFDTRSHNYTISLAEEAAKVGFDEINFDYIRFPAKSNLLYSKNSNQINRINAINLFLKTAKAKLRKYGVFISVDTFGTICWNSDDSLIGQSVESLAKYADYLAPMLYPSGFASKTFGFKYASEYPYKVVYKSLQNIKNRVNSNRVRPWLQNFRDYAHKKRKYKKFEIQEQIRATKNSHSNGWMIWSPSSKYNLHYFKSDKK